MGFRVIVVDDDPADQLLVRKALVEQDPTCGVDVVSDGDALLEGLRAGPGAPRYQRPDLILLDLNMPRIDGRDVLRALKADPSLASIPVVVLSTSSAPRDVEDAYSLHANCFVTKPADLAGFRRAVGAIHEFWREVAAHPGA